MNEFEKNPETVTPPVPEESVPPQETPQQEVPQPEPIASAETTEEPAAELVSDPTLEEPAAEETPAASEVLPAEPPVPETTPEMPEVPAAEGTPIFQPQDFPPPPPGYDMPPYPMAMPNGYPPQPPVKKKMPIGLKFLIIVMSILFVGSLVGLAVYGAFSAATAYTDGFKNYFEYLPEEYADPEEDEDAETNKDSQEEFVLDIPDIEVIPNTDGITLHGQPIGGEMDITDIYNKIIPSTVLVITTSDSGYGTGTGIIATEDGYIITNSHVVLNTRSVQVEVKTSDGETHDAVVVGYDKTTDLAVLKIEGAGYTPAEFGDSNDLSMGQWVLAIGNPGGEQFSGSITRGIISGLDRSVGSYSSNGMTYIQTDAAINPGNSGGPLVNLYGQVVGINSAKIVSDQYEGMGFAIPITGAKEIIDDLLSGGYVEGRVRFGITGVEVTEAQAIMTSVPQGFMIVSFDEESSFTGTDVQIYDIITALDGEETPDLDSLSNALLNYEPGDSVTVSLFRPNENSTGGEEFEVTVTLLADKGETQN